MKLYGLPVVTAGELPAFLEASGIKPWPEAKPPMTVTVYLQQDLAPEELDEATRFAPHAEVVFLKDPRGELFTGFRSVADGAVIVFVLLDEEYVLLTAEYKHGFGKVVIVPVAGTMKRGEDPVAVAKLECLQETGIELERVEILNGPMGISARKSTEFVVLCVGSPKLPIQRQPPRPDQDEHMAVFLMPWRDLFDLIVLDAIVDEQMLAITYCALHRLDKIGFI